VGRAAAVLLNEASHVLKRRDSAIRKIGDAEKAGAAYDAAYRLALNIEVTEETRAAMSGVELSDLMGGAGMLAGALDLSYSIFEKAEKDEKEQTFSFAWETPFGVIELNGADDHTYTGDAYFLIIDTGGADTYHAGAGTTPDVPISVIIDLAGDDHYTAKETKSFGVGILGYGMLLDCAGNDVYEGRNTCFGVGSFGAGILIDRAGNDTYTVRRLGQGAGVFGVGVLSDVAGDDKYNCFHQAEGYGATKGFGALIDKEGDDVYYADDKKLDFPSPQTPHHNTSLAQGVGFGARSSSLAGGIGVVVDGKGNDTYSAGLFAQGAAYWYALGMLVDFEGNDSFRAVWYNQGSSAHYAVGALCDLGGNDVYRPGIQGMGAGHDQSTGFLYDAKGDDLYEGGGNIAGHGGWNAIGVFWDGDGEDVYNVGGGSLGFGLHTSSTFCMGLFIDEGGRAELPEDDDARAGGLWIRPQKEGKSHVHGLGMAK
jgi:hypothetical protein